MSTLLLDSSSPEQSGKRLKYIRTHLLNLTRLQLCENTPISVAALKAWELGLGGGLTPKGAEKLLPRLQELGIYCSVPWLLHGIGTPATFQTTALQADAVEDAQMAEELLTFRRQGNTLDSVIADDGLLPVFVPGSWVGGIIQPKLSECIGKICIIVSQSNEIYVRVLQAGDAPDCFHLECLNPQPHLTKRVLLNIPIKMVAPVVWNRRKA